MSDLSPIKARKLLKVLKKLGFIEKRQKGSHLFLAHADGRTTVIPIHPTKEISRGLLRSILEDIELSVKELNKLL